MSILQAMFTGVSGIQAEGEALGVVGDNIANSNTVGFKSERSMFQNVLGHSISAGASTVPGAGVRMAGVQQLFSQGSISHTGVSTDLALSGDGFLVVKGSIDGLTSNFYTRDGELKIDANGFIVTQEGLQAQGYKALPNGTFEAALSSLKVPTAAIPAFATTQVAVTANLDSKSPVFNQAAAPVGNPFDPQDPSRTSNFASSISVFDSLGNAHTISVYFVKTADTTSVPPTAAGTSGTWTWHALANAAELDPVVPGPNVEIGTGDLTFSTSGTLQSSTQAAPMTASFAGATALQLITPNFGTPVTPTPPATTIGTGLDGVTQFSGSSNVSSQSQDGYASGDLSGITIDGVGVVKGLYSNGQKLPIGQLAVAKFRSNEGLSTVGHNLWTETRDSGNAAMGTAGSGGRASMSSGAIEQSNVDLAQQFVDLIQHQRAFTANSKTITTADQMLQVLENLKQ